MCDISQINVCHSLDSRLIRAEVLFGSLFHLQKQVHCQIHSCSLYILLGQIMTGQKNLIHCFPPNLKWPTYRCLLFPQRHWLPDSTGTALFKKVIELLAEAVLLLTEVERARQRKDNKNQMKRKH